MESISKLLPDSKETYTVEEMRELQVKQYNDEPGDLNKTDGIECPICKNKGWIQYINEDGYISMMKCSCDGKRKAFRRAKNSGLGEYLTKRLSDYQATEPWQISCKEKAKKFMEKHADDGTWFLACGTSGSGKTLLCSIIANYLLYKKSREVMYITWTDFISRTKRNMMGDKAKEVSTALDDIKNCDVLFMDEVVKSYTEADLRYLIEILNYRYTNNKKTLITSEKVLSELLDIDEAAFGRAVEKSNGFIINIPKDRKKNYRLRVLGDNLPF